QDSLKDAVEPWVGAAKSLKQLDLLSILTASLSPSQKQHLDRFYPTRIESPDGSKIRVKYEGEGPPKATAKLQQFFGTVETPKVGPMAHSIPWVVLVDDEESIRLALGDLLFDEGYQVTACADADSLLEVLEAEQDDRLPDAIVSDIRMPLSSKNGYELVETIRSVPKWSGIPVVMLTAKAMTQDRVEGYRVGADAFLPKPFDPNELLSILDNVIMRSQQRGRIDGGESALQNEKASAPSELLVLKQQLDEIKDLMEKNSASTVQKTNVFLTDNERGTLQLICDGYTYSEIAEDRNVSVASVNRFVQKLYEETETKTRTELVKWAVQVGYAV
ncbi:MAG: hypothetical protein SGILL_008188, partial [Bacillariaceae sp.]